MTTTTTERRSGVGMHYHPDVLFEYVWDAQEQERIIKFARPEEWRLELYQLFPRERLPAALQVVLGELEEALGELEEAEGGLAMAEGELDRPWVRGEPAWAELDRVWVQWSKALTRWEETLARWQGTLAAHTPALEALHAELCPGCPWNGTTIFPESRR